MHTAIPSPRHRPAAPAGFWSQGFSSSIDHEATRQHPNASDREHPSLARRRQPSASPGRLLPEPSRPSGRAGLTPEKVLARYQPGQVDPMRVLEVLMELFNTQHTALQKTVSHKTRHERALFLQRFFRDLTLKCGFKTAPDPRNLGQKHIHAMVQVWRRDKLAPATIQTYLSFLRGLSMWVGKPGLVLKPAAYGLKVEEYRRHEIAKRDKSWSAQGVDVDAVLVQAVTFDPRVAASMRLMHTFGLRRKESVTCRPWVDLVPFESTGLPSTHKQADQYLWTKGKGGRERWLPVQTEDQKQAIKVSQSLTDSRDGHMGNPAHGLKRNLRRLDYGLAKLGITRKGRGVTGHGLRHGRLNDIYEDITGQPSVVRGGGEVSPELDRKARLAASATAGHSRHRAASAYLGAVKRFGTKSNAN
jgi:site-specific recombinase XerC